MRPPLVRLGEDARLPDGEHKAQPVYTEMMLHVARDYAALDPRTMTFSEILFWYDGLRNELREYSKPRK